MVNVYDERDLVQGFLGKFDKENWNPLAPNPKQTIPNAINIKVKPEKIKTPNHLSPLEQGSYYSSSKIKNYLNSHSTIKNAEKWNQSVAPILEGK